MRRVNADRSEKRGVSYVMVLFTIAILGTLCLSFTLMTGFQREIAANHETSVQAHYLARAGVNVAIWRVLNETGFVSANDGVPISYAIGDMSVTYVVQEAENNDSILVASTGTVQNATTVLRHLLIQAGGGGGPVIDPTLIGWWKLDENHGLVAEDSSLYNNDGTLGNMVGNEWTAGQIDGGLEFDGWDDYVDTSIMSDEVTNLTFTAWFKSDDAGSIGDDYVAQRIISHPRTSTNSRLALGINNNRIATYWYDGGHNVREGTTTLTAGVWYHIALTYDGAALKIYLNGEEENSFDESSMTAPSASATIKIARHIDGSRDFAGVLDDVRVYNRALTADEIALVHAGGGVLYRQFTEAKADTAVASLTIQTPGDTSETNLLIAAVATDGETSSSLAPPGGEGWTEIDIGDRSNNVTLGVWWKLADASESPSHEFTWTGGQEAYAWMMRFIGHDTGGPLDDTATDGETDISPASPEVTTSINDALILRLGAFDDDDITVDSPGLPGHTAITMDTSGAAGPVYESFTETKVGADDTSITIATPGIGLVGQWKLDEASGSTTADDSTGLASAATLQNDPAGAGWTTGRIVGAFQFDGVDDFFATPTSSTELQLTADYSISTWIYAESSQKPWAGIVSRCTPTGNDNHWTLQFDDQSGTSKRVTVYHPNGQRWNSSYTLADAMDAWRHIVITYRESPARVQLYVDGAFHSESTSLTQGPGYGNGKLHIGGERTGSSAYVFNGKIDDVRVYDRLLSLEEISQLAAERPSSGISEGDLLVAAVATDGDTTGSLSEPFGEGWTQIDVRDYNNEVTLGGWWKLADASESASHEFTWSGGQQAYGWMMHFTGHDPSDPIDVYATAGESNSTPTSPSVSTTVENATILRLGVFDDSDITEDDPGLSGHTAITMDTSGSGGGQVAFQNFEETKLASDGTSLTIDTPVGTSQGDLLIAAVSTDGNTSGSLSPPGSEGWAEIDLNDRSGAVTLGVWWKLAGASESPSHQFTWSGSQEAYGWIMRFIGHNQADPIDVSGATGGSSSSPDCPEVTSTVSNTMIVGIGGFDDDDVNVDNTGLSGYTDITMDQSSGGSGTCSGGAGYVQQPAVGDSGTEDFTLNGWEQYRTVTVAIAPAVGSGGAVSGGAGYVAQSSTGASGTSDFELTASQEAQMLTVAIAPDPTKGPVSGGAGYVEQPSSGDSGTSTFSLTASEEARTVTLAIAPAGG